MTHKKLFLQKNLFHQKKCKQNCFHQESQNVTKLKKSKFDTQKLNVTKLKNSNCDSTPKLKLLQNSKTQCVNSKTQNVTKLKKSKCDKTKKKSDFDQTQKFQM